MAGHQRRERIFTYEEVLDSFPAVRHQTQLAQRRIEALCNQLRSREELEARREELEGAVQAIVTEWTDQVSALGCRVKGLWLVDWDSGDGYFCWCYPEDTVTHFHGYEDGFAGRVPVH